ncbi:SDR family oxidoreductase [Paenibacillus sp. KQZ6P-2]|uniref:SDR family oxidoreductase n=1 Tax=Paenibacillus mangrovi TaxID=2931978 RepID=A0A9X2B854_9BACL|nr:SDR family oxidoreductase [Paenibacillus mangrovi]MCJ8014118.1 SDR family oxidoreductase [Paenibacillus mangrovi]
MHRLLELYGSWALVTGASSGIGAEFASQLAQCGMNLVLSARRKDKLQELADTLAELHGVQVKIAPADLSQPDFIQDIRRVTDGLNIGLLVNCAGFSVTGTLLSNDIQTELDMLHVNCRAPLLLSHTFGKEMARRGQGGIIFTASVVAFSPAPYWTHYAATKAYNFFIGEGLAYELKNSGIDVLTVCPGATKSGFQEVAGISDIGTMSPVPVVQSALRALGKRSIIIPGWHNRVLFRGISRWIPRRIRLGLFAGSIKRLQSWGASKQ